MKETIITKRERRGFSSQKPLPFRKPGVLVLITAIVLVLLLNLINTILFH